MYDVSLYILFLEYLYLYLFVITFFCDWFHILLFYTENRTIFAVSS